MTNRSKAKGTRHERDILDFIRGRGQKAERLALSGTLDEGDIAHAAGPWTFVLEAKNEKSMTLSSYVDEAVREAHQYSRARGGVPTLPAAVVKRRNRGVNESYVVIPLERFLGLTSWLDDLYASSDAATRADFHEGAR